MVNTLALRGADPETAATLADYVDAAGELYNATRELLRRRRERKRARAVRSSRRQKEDPVPVSKLMVSPANSNMRNALRKGTIAWTWCRYIMSPVINKNTAGFELVPGRGPSLMWATQETKTQVGLANTLMPTAWQSLYTASTILHHDFGAVRPMTSLTSTNPLTKTGIMFDYGTCYLFVADWPFLTMHWDKNTQYDSAGDKYRILEWEYTPLDNTDDPSNPIQLTTPINKSLLYNNDWQKLTHLSTQLAFDFTNINWCPMVVEVLIFRIVPDLDSLDYRQSCKVVSNGFADFNSYAEQKQQYFGVPNYYTIARKRMIIPGLQSTAYLPHATDDIGFVQSENLIKRNTRKLQCNIRRKYTITRPVLAGATDISGETEDSFFNKYYNKERSILCRVQSWPLDPLFTTKANVSGITKAQYNSLNNMNDQWTTLLNDTTDNGEIIPSVMCRMEKRTYMTFDAIMLKGPFKN